MKTRLNYKECREKIFKLFENKRFVTRKEMVNVLDLNMENYNDYCRFLNFLYYTRKWALKKYYKTKEEMEIPKIMNHAYFLNKDGSIEEFIKFCETNRIPYIHYIHQNHALYVYRSRCISIYS